MIDFSNMLGKPLRHCFVPADQASVTFVFEDGMRRSFAVENAGGTRLTPVSIAWVFSSSNVSSSVSPDPTEGVVFTEVKNLIGETGAGVGFYTKESGVTFSFPSGGHLVELPE
jgi:hypothetical protein